MPDHRKGAGLLPVTDFTALEEVETEMLSACFDWPQRETRKSNGFETTG